MSGQSKATSRNVPISLGERSYEVLIGAGGIASFGERLAGLGGISKVAVVTNPTVRALYGAAVAASLEACAEFKGKADRVHWIELPDGEQFKNSTSIEAIWDAALAARLDRNSVIVALGGGVIGDMAGFAAATVLRGIRFVQIPTTLLAQVDSSVGGKTGINRPLGKNLVGAFHQPSLVVADIDTLTTLPEREFKAGLAEVVKYGVILDEPFFAEMELQREALVARDPAVLARMVERSVEIKGQVVAADEHEGGLRKVLNFGHTVGHAIEQVTGYKRYLHGEAVAMGMGAAAALSRDLGICGADVVERLNALLGALGLASGIPADLDLEAIATAVGFDKKVESGRVSFIVCEAIGRVRVQKLSAEEVGVALRQQART